MRRSSLLVVLPVVLLLCAACASGDDDTSGTVPTVITSDEPPTSSAPPAGPTTPLTEPALAPASTVPPRADLPSVPPTVPPGDTDVDRAIADVVARTGLDAAAVVLIAEDAVTWRDSSIGCPQQGMQYLQVITEGTRIVLDAGGQRFEYHRGGRRDLFYCAAPQPPVGE